MRIRAIVALLVLAAALPILAGRDARANGSCDADTVRDRLTQLEHAFQQPKVQAGLAAAKKDWDEDQDFDNEEDLKYLAAVAAYHDIKRNFDAGAVEDACMLLKRSDPMVQAVLADL